MARQPYGIEKAIRLYIENTDNAVDFLVGTAAPDGTSSGQDVAAIGSLYIRQGTGELYQKVANVGAPSDYQLFGGAEVGKWRGEKVRAVTNDTVTPGSPRNLTTTPFADDEGTQLDSNDFTVGEFIIADADGTPVLLEVTNVSAPNVTFSTPSQAPVLSEGDTFISPNYLPDSPDAQEGQAIVNYNGSVMVRIASIGWNFADGIDLASGYSASSGDVTPSDSVQGALEKIDGNNDAQDTLLGTSQGDVDLGTFSGNTISDNNTVKGALQEIETAHEETDQNVDDLITLSGSPENSTDHGTFTTTVITDGSNTKEALEELGSKDEAQDVIINEIDANVDDLITLSGQPENSTNLGAFTGFGAILFTATETIRSAFQAVADFLGNLRSVESVSLSTQTAVDSVPVSTIAACKWFIVAFEEATPANREAIEVYAINDGTNADFNEVSKLKLGTTGGQFVQVDVDVSGGNMRLLIDTNTAGLTVRARRIAVEDI
jgi:hypothetical protein